VYFEYSYYTEFLQVLIFVGAKFCVHLFVLKNGQWELPEATIYIKENGNILAAKYYSAQGFHGLLQTHKY